MSRSPPGSNHSNSPAGANQTYRYKSLDEVKVEDYKYSVIEEREDGTKLVNGELCYRPHDAYQNDDGDWILISNKIGVGLTQGKNTRLNGRYGETDKFLEGDKVIVPAPALNQLNDGGLIRGEVKKINDVLHRRIDWIPTRQGSNNNLLDYVPCWVQCDNILLYNKKGRSPAVTAGGTEETSASSARRESRDLSWTFESLRPLSLNKEVLSDKEGKLFIMVTKNKLEHAVWGRPVSAVGEPDGTKYDLKCIGIESLGAKNATFAEAKAGFEPYRLKECMETTMHLKQQAERTRSLQSKNAILRQAATHLKTKKSQKDVELDEKVEEGEEQKEEEEEENENGVKVVQQSGKSPEKTDDIDTSDGQPLSMSGLDQYEELDPDFLAQFAADDSTTINRESLIEQFGLSRDLLDEPGAVSLIDEFLKLRAKAGEAVEEISGWKNLVQKYDNEFRDSVKERRCDNEERKEAMDQLQQQIEEIRKMGTGFGSIMQTMTNMLTQNMDTSEALKALVLQMASELDVKIVQPAKLPEAFGKDLWVQIENFVKFFGRAGSYRIVRSDQPTTTLPLSTDKTPSLVALSKPAPNPEPPVSATAPTTESLPTPVSPTKSPLREAPVVKPPKTNTKPGNAPIAITRKPSSEPGSGLRVIAPAKPTSQRINCEILDARPRPKGPWDRINFIDNPFFSGQSFSQFVTRLETRFKNKMKPTQLAAFCFMYWSNPGWNALQASAQEIQQRVKNATSNISNWQQELVATKYNLKTKASKLATSESQPVAKSRSPSPANVRNGKGSRVSRGGAAGTSGGRGSRGGGRGRGRGRTASSGAKRQSYVPTVPDNCNPFAKHAPVSHFFYDTCGWTELYSADDLDIPIQKCIAKNPSGSTYEWVSFSLNHMLQVLVLRRLTDHITCFLDLSLSLRALRDSLDVKALPFNKQVLRSKGHPWFFAAVDGLCTQSNRNLESLLEVGENPLLLLVDKCIKACSVWLSRGSRGRDILGKGNREVLKHIHDRQVQRYIELLPGESPPVLEPLASDDDEEEDSDDSEGEDADDASQRQSEMLSSASPVHDDDNELMQFANDAYGGPPAKAARIENDEDDY